MSLYRHLHSRLGSAHKIVLAVCTFVMAIALPAIAKADVVSTPRVGRSSVYLVAAAVSILVAVIGAIFIIWRNR